jgi:RNA polymerase sigma-70 factor (ECF subfamily)
MGGLKPSKASIPAPDSEEINSPEFLAVLSAPGPAGRQAFARLVQGTHDRFLGFIRRQLPSQEESLDVLQEVYLAVHKGLAGFEGKSKLTTWMYSLAHHKICDRLADRDRRHQELTEGRQDALSTEAGAERWDGITAWDAPPDRLSARNAVEGLIGKAIEALPEQARRVYHLRDVEGLSGEETAEATGLSADNVRVQLHRARRQIVDWVQEKMASVRKAETDRAGEPKADPRGKAT